MHVYIFCIFNLEFFPFFKINFISDCTVFTLQAYINNIIVIIVFVYDEIFRKFFSNKLSSADLLVS